MAGTRILYPQAIDVLLPILDGWTPITARDLNAYQDALRRLEEVLGAGAVDAGGNWFGPSGANSTLRERLDRFLDPIGTLRDVAYVTGTVRLAEFDEEGAGCRISLGKPLSRGGFGGDSYRVLFTYETPERIENSPGPPPELWHSDAVPACWWVHNKALDAVWLKARTMTGRAVATYTDTQVKFALLAVGYEALCTV